MFRKKILAILILIIIIGTAKNNVIAQNTAEDFDNSWTGPEDIGGNVPIPGAIYFLLAALGLGAKKLYNYKKSLNKKE